MQKNPISFAFICVSLQMLSALVKTTVCPPAVHTTRHHAGLITSNIWCSVLTCGVSIMSYVFLQVWVP
jgi:hypothetical protein